MCKFAEKSSYLLTWDAHADTRSYTYIRMYICASLFSSRWGRRGWAKGKSFEQFQPISSPFSTAFHRRGGGPGYTAGEKRRNCWNNGRAYGTARRTKRWRLRYLEIQFRYCSSHEREGQNPRELWYCFVRPRLPRQTLAVRSRRKQSCKFLGRNAISVVHTRIM